MHPNHAAVQMFLKAQEARDPIRLQGALHPDTTLHDPLIGELKGTEVFAWWQMIWRFRNHAVTIVDGKGAPMGGDATWKLGYTHPRTRRALLIHISTTFEFRENKIHVQRDSYGLYGYLRQALGKQGTMLGWLPPVQWQLRGAARDRLEAFMDEHGITDDSRLLEQVKPKRRGDSIPDVGEISFARSKGSFD